MTTPSTSPERGQDTEIPAHVREVQKTGLLDTSAEEVFDRFTALASKIIGAPVVLVSLVDQDRQFFKSQIGLPEPWASQRETPLSHSFCQHVVATQQPLIIADARLHPLVAENLAIQDLGVIAYAGIPLVAPSGQAIGSFCAIDIKERLWSEHEIEVLTGLAQAVMTEIALRMTAKTLQDSNAALREAEVRRDEMVHMVIHDLRTPLSSLVGGLQAMEALVMSEPEPDPVLKQMLDISLRGGRELAQMVNTILDVNRGESMSMAIHCQEVELRGLIEKALAQTAQLAQQKNLSVRSEIGADVLCIEADEDNLRRVLVNLLGNAIQHTSPGGEIVVGAQLQDEGNNVLLSVRDTGVGIPKVQFKTIFEKFGRADANNKAHASTGLGLTFCKMVVQEHGGSIWVESEVGVGTTFFFSLPCRRPE